MKTIGLIGGMSWESTAEYYRLLNEAVKEKLGGLHSARCILYSVDFAEIETLQREGQWAEATTLLVGAAQSLERAGAGVVLLCTNTMHKLADLIAASVRIPFLHIADAAAQSVMRAGIRRVALLGTRFTMEEHFYRGRLKDRFDLDVLIPGETGRETVHRIIYRELCVGIVRPESKQELIQITNEMIKNGAQGVILGCTELGLLIRDGDVSASVFDTTRLHVVAALETAFA